MRFEILMNEAAGSVDEGVTVAIREAFAAAGAEIHMCMVDPDDLERAIINAWSTAPDAVVIAGGDGTQGSAAGVAAGTDIVIAPLPLGTFNNFAKALGVPGDLGEAAAALASGQARSIDVGEVNGRVFVNNSALGVYPAMVDLRDDIRGRRGWGKVRAAPVASWRAFRRFPTHRITLTTADGTVRRDVRTPFVFIGNGAYEDDSGRAAGERASLTEGELSVYVTAVVSRWRLVKAAVAALLRGTDRAADLDRVRTTELRIDTRSTHIRVAIDGEVVSLRPPLRYRIRPADLNVLAPAP